MDQLRPRVKRAAPAVVVVLALVAAVVTASAPRGTACDRFTISVPAVRVHIGPVPEPTDFSLYGAPAAPAAPDAGTVHVESDGPITVTPDCG